MFAIDCFSNFIAVRPMTSRSGETIIATLETMFREDFDGRPNCIEADQEGGLISEETQNYFHEKNIYFHRKFGQNKAFRAEYTIGVVKRKLQAILRKNEDNNWPPVIEKIAYNINHTVCSKHGFKPAEVANHASDEKVREAMIAKKKYVVESLDDAMERTDRYKKSFRQDLLYIDDVVQLNEHIHGLDGIHEVSWYLQKCIVKV